MDRPPRQEWIIEVLREAQLRLSQGELVASICKSLGISPSSYRRWRRMYGERVIENAAAVASESPEQRASAPATSTENILTKPAGAHPNGKVPNLSEEAQGFLDEANGASDPASSAWFAFLALLTYLLVTLAGVSHKALLLDSPVALPIVVNVDIPLRSFFLYAPALLLLVYLSLLIQHVILARKYRKFKEAIDPYERETRTEHPARERVQSYVFSQILVGPKPSRITKFMMQLIVYVTFTILPLITLLYFQIKFLPYHEVWITYWHRIAVILGLLMLILLTPRIVKVGPQAEAWQVSRMEKVLGVLLVIASLCFSWLIATVPDEEFDQLLGFVAPTSVGIGAEQEAKLLNPILRCIVYDRLVNRLVNDDDKGWWRRWLLSYRVLIVEDTDLGADDDAKVVLRERNFRFALLSRSDLHRADLAWADLRATQMWKTLAKGKLKDAQLQGASLQEAQLQGAQLNSAQLQGADLSYAQLQGADLNAAKLQGANLSYAQLQGADLRSAKLQGADLRSAQLQGANLSYAQLQGADLRSAKLQGAELRRPRLQGANLKSAEVWLVDFPRSLTNQSPIPVGLADLKIMSPLTKEAKAKLNQDLKASITDPKVLSVVTDRLDPILRDHPPNWDAEDAAWEAYVKKAKERELSANQLAQFHANLACHDTEGYIANSMARRAEQAKQAAETKAPSSFTHLREAYAKPFVSALLDENCKGGMALTRETREALRKLVSAPE